MASRKIFGYEWEDIQRALRGGRLSHPVDTSKPISHAPTDDDRKLLVEYGSISALKSAGFNGIADRLEKWLQSRPAKNPTRRKKKVCAKWKAAKRAGPRNTVKRRARARNPFHPIVLCITKAGRTLYYEAKGEKFTSVRRNAKHFKTARHAALVGRLMLLRHGKALQPYKMAVVAL
jgi:hypothetical protein